MLMQGRSIGGSFEVSAVAERSFGVKPASVEAGFSIRADQAER